MLSQVKAYIKKQINLGSKHKKRSYRMKILSNLLKTKFSNSRNYLNNGLIKINNYNNLNIIKSKGLPYHFLVIKIMKKMRNLNLILA